MIVNYCERTGPGLFDEPLNAATNAAFLIAAWAVWRLARFHPLCGSKGRARPPDAPSSAATGASPAAPATPGGSGGPALPCFDASQRQERRPGIGVLVALLVAIGIGSTLFHTFATEWSRWMDVVPILLFQLFCTWLYARTVMGAGAFASIGVLAAFFGAGFLTSLLPHDALNGSLMYAPAWLFLVLLGIHHHAAAKPERWIMLAAAGVFTLSLFFRTIDIRMVGVFPPGTHFLWHILNGATLYLAARAVIVGRKDP